MKKKIIFYLNNDEIFTLPIAFFLIKKFIRKYNISIKLANTSLRKKIKIILILFLENSIFKLFYFYKKKISIEKLIVSKNVCLVKEIKKNEYLFGVSINYPKKITDKTFNIYNFHFGNFKKQRGTFIFFYKNIFKWNNIDLTFHQIKNKFDSGTVINKKMIYVKKMNTLELIALPLKNKDFYFKSMLKIFKNNNKNKKNSIGPLNKEPSFVKIFKAKFN